MGGKKWSVIGLILWFVIYGLLTLTNLSFALSGVILGLLALFIAVTLLFDK